MLHFNKELNYLPQIAQISTDEFVMYLITLFNSRQKLFLTIAKTGLST